MRVSGSSLTCSAPDGVGRAVAHVVEQAVVTAERAARPRRRARGVASAAAHRPTAGFPSVATAASTARSRADDQRDATRAARPRPGPGRDRWRRSRRSRSRRSTVGPCGSSITLLRLRCRCAIASRTLAQVHRDLSSTSVRSSSTASSRVDGGVRPRRSTRPSIAANTSDARPVGCADAIASGSAACTPACAASEASNASCSTRCFAVANGVSSSTCRKAR